MLLDVDYNPTQGQITDDGLYNTLQPSPPLNHWVQSYWQLNVPKGKYSYHSVPDNCVDWIINLNRFEDNVVIPPFLSHNVFQLDGPASFFGIRFRVLGHAGLTNTPIGEWGLDNATKAEDVLPTEAIYSVFESIEKAQRFEDRCDKLSAKLISFVRYPDVDSRLANYVRYCHENMSSRFDLSDKQCAQFGVSARQLRRLTKLHLGMLPKDFAKVLRFQHTLKAINTQQYNAVWLDHYYDQAHFIREFKQMSGLTPNQFRNVSVLYNHNSSA